VEKVGGGRIVNNDTIVKLTIKSRQIFYKNAVKESAMLSKKSIRAKSFLIKEIQNWLCVFRQGRRVNDQLITLTHSFQKFINPWSLLDKHIAYLSIYLYLKIKI